MKKLILLIGLLISSQTLWAQTAFNPPDYKFIETATSDSSSEMYYPKLLQRYRNNDNLLGIEEYRMLYFGRFFHEGEESAFGSSLSDASDKLREYWNKDTLVDEDLKEMVKLSDEILKDNPFDLRTLYRTYKMHMKLGDSIAAAPYLIKTRLIVNTIVSTGDGLSEKTAFHVLDVSHEYFIVNALGYTYGGSQSLTPNTCDYLALAENEDNLQGLYFDVNQIFGRYRKIFEDNPPTLPKMKKKRKKKDK